eukprot:symbB.v1.2.011887.t1/scaffold806.1/size231046/14
MLEVLSAVTGEPIAFLEEVEFAEGEGSVKVKALKQLLAPKIGMPRFRLRLLQDNCALDDDQTLIDDQTFTLQVVQLVILKLQPPDMEQDQGIILACEENDDALLEQQLNQPRNPNFYGANRFTPLYAAASNGSLKCVLLLLEAGANKDQGRTSNGATPLYVAALQGHLEVVRFLVESGANKDQGTTDNGATPLYVAADQGHLEVVRFLVESGANKDQCRTDDGSTPLHIAAHEGDFEVVRFLVESGASKDQGDTEAGRTPLFEAALNGHLEVVRFLVESGANKDQGTTNYGATPLFIAARMGHLEVIRFLVESGANKDQGTTVAGMTLLFIAAQNGHLEVVRFLLSRVPTKTKAGQTMEQRLCTWQLSKGTLKLSDFWLSLSAPYSSATASSGLYADELLRRLQGCQSFDEGRATCAEMMNAFHQDQHCQQLLRPRNVPAPTIPASSATPMEQTASGSVNANAELMARLQSLQGANRLIVRALRIMSERLREQGQRSRQAEETVEQLKSELQAQGDQLRASERAKALLQSRLEVMLREDLLPPECGRPCT